MHNPNPSSCPEVSTATTATTSPHGVASVNSKPVNPASHNQSNRSKPPCPLCDDADWYIGVFEHNGQHGERHITCQCAAGRALVARRNAHLLALSSLPETCQSWTFSSYAKFALTAAQQDARLLVQTFVDTGSVLNRRGLYLYGDVGRGKSGLASAAVNRAVQCGNTALYVTVPDLLDHLRSTHAPDTA